jgi:hypothetical protein
VGDDAGQPVQAWTSFLDINQIQTTPRDFIYLVSGSNRPGKLHLLSCFV